MNETGGRKLEAAAMIMAVLFLTGGILAFLVSRGSIEALIVSVVLIVLFLLGLGGAAVMAIVLFANRINEQRELREQARFQDNVRENLAIMAATARVQSAQTQAQNSQTAGMLKQIREYRRQLPAPGEDGNIDALVFDDAVFDELEG